MRATNMDLFLREKAKTILGLQGEVSATEIKRAYRRLAQECHPDRHPGDPEKEERFKLVSEAYEILTKPKSAGKYRLEKTTVLGYEAYYKWWRQNFIDSI